MSRLSPHLKLDGTPKPGYASHAAASRYRALIIENNGAYPPSVQIYACPVCKLLHIGRWLNTDRKRKNGTRRGYHGAW